MFGWFKRKPKPVTQEEAVSTLLHLEQGVQSALLTNPYANMYLDVFIQESLVFVKTSRGAPVRVRSRDYVLALGLVARIDKAISQKKKHSHLLAELKALEVKHEDA